MQKEETTVTPVIDSLESNVMEENKETVEVVANDPRLSTPLSLIVYGIPNRFKAKHVAKILEEHGITYSKLDRPFRQSVAKLKFNTVEERELAASKLDNFEVEDSTWRVKKAHDLYKVRNLENIKSNNKRRKTEETEDGEEKRSILDQIVPWHNKPYEEQLKEKQSAMRTILFKITMIVKKHSFNNLPRWMKDIQRAPCCPLEPIIPSPKTEEYVNF